MINVLRYCHLDESLKGEPGLVSNEGLQRIFDIKELDYLTHIVLRMYENTAVRSLKICSENFFFEYTCFVFLLVEVLYNSITLFST